MKKRRRKRTKRRTKLGFIVAVLVAGLVASLAAWEILFLQLTALRDQSTIRVLTVRAPGDTSQAFVLGPKNPYWTPLGAISKELVLCVLKAEDDRFFGHRGFDWKAIRRAFETNVEQGRYARGGSTITMQLARNLFLWRGKSLPRKILEAYLTWRLEQTLSKERILELYLNVAEWGPGLYGIGQASHHYFHKRPADLTLGESALLAGILPNPVGWNPERAPQIAIERQQELLGRLRRENALTHLDQDL